MQRATVVLPQPGSPKMPATPLVGMLNCAFSGKRARFPLNATSIQLVWLSSRAPPSEAFID